MVQVFSPIEKITMKFIKFIYIPAFILLISIGCNAAKLNNSFLNNDSLKQTDNTYQKEKGTKRIVSYNVKHCEGMDKVIDYDRIAKIVNSLNPDIVCIQELDSMTNRSNKYQVKVLGINLGCTVISVQPYIITGVCMGSGFSPKKSLSGLIITACRVLRNELF